ncbi:MAG: hypothetical protein ACR2OR_07815 [Hyphomicrobiales bacterium]
MSGFRYRRERRAAIWFIGGFAAAMIAGQVLDETHCTFDSAHEKPMLNWLGRLCSDIRVSSTDLSTGGASLNKLPARGALKKTFTFTD